MRTTGIPPKDGSRVLISMSAVFLSLNAARETTTTAKVTFCSLMTAAVSWVPWAFCAPTGGTQNRTRPININAKRFMRSSFNLFDHARRRRRNSDVIGLGVTDELGE